MSVKLRLLKVIVQPVLVEDNGTELTERPAQPVEIPGAEWGEYPERLAEQIDQLERELNK